jgi:hypothetical protein
MLRLFIFEHLSKVSTFASKVIGLTASYEQARYVVKENKFATPLGGKIRALTAHNSDATAILGEDVQRVRKPSSPGIADVDERAHYRNGP